MEDFLVAAMAFGLTGLILLVLGYLIKYRGMTNLIAGYSPERVRDERGLANWAGGVALFFGGYTVAVGLLLFLFLQVLPVLAALYVLTITVGTVVLVLGCRRYMV